MWIIDFIKSIFKKIASAWTNAIETQREIITEVAEKDYKLAVREDKVDPNNYVGFEYKGVWMVIRKVEIPEWENASREVKRDRVQALKTKLKKGQLKYEIIDGQKMIVDPKKVLHPKLYPH